MLSCETSLRCVNKRYEVSIFAQFCAFEQEFRAVVFVYFPRDLYGPGCGVIEKCYEQKISHAKAEHDRASSVRKSCTTQPYALQDAC